MTVISKPRIAYFTAPNQNYSSTESLDSAGIGNTHPFFNNETSIRRTTEPENTQNRFVGRRKARRYLNQRFLLDNLKEEPEGTVSLLEPYRAYFTCLTQDEFWHDFQEEKERGVFNSKERVKATDFKRISRNIKRVLRKRGRMAVALLRDIEAEVVDFFQEVSDTVYVRIPKNYLERLLFYGVSQFYGLNSTSAIVQGQFVVEVENLSEKLIPYIHYYESLFVIIANK